MITQKIIARTDSLKLDKIISRYGEDSMRQVVFIIVRPDPDSEELIPITIPEDAVGSFRILKPSGNFVIVPMSKSVLASGETAFDVVLPASANTAKGSGYYDIRITSDTDKYYFTAQGDFIIDDNIISDEVLEDVSEVNGLIFPDDFLTVEDHVAYIDDDTISTDSTWSSDKISEEIEAHDGGDVSKTVSGNPVTFTDGADAPLVKCDVTITGSQDLHGYDKPWVGGAGKNKCILFPNASISGVTFTTQSDGSVVLSGTTASTQAGNSTDIYSIPAGTYVLSGAPSGSSIGSYDIYVRNQDNNTIIARDYSGSTAQEFTLSATTNISVTMRVPQGNIDTTKVFYPMIRANYSSATYEPYSNICPISGYSSVGVNVAPTTTDTPQTYTINLGGTYYSGQIDAVKGVLVADKASKTFNGSENWMTNGDRGVFITLSSLGGDIKPFGNLVFSDYEVIDPGDAPSTPGKANFNRVGTAIQIRDPNGMTDTAYKAFLATHNVQMVYELATPITIPLTPTVISSLLGNNTIWTDGDSMEIEYITERFQPLIDSIKQL